LNTNPSNHWKFLPTFFQAVSKFGFFNLPQEWKDIYRFCELNGWAPLHDGEPPQPNLFEDYTKENENFLRASKNTHSFEDV
jgi:hypothetical protein